MEPLARKPRPLAGIAGALVMTLGAFALAQPPTASVPLDDAASTLHGTCARRAARVLTDRTAAPLARQGRWIAAIERGRRASFRTVHEAAAAGRPAQAFVALLDYARSADAARRYDDASAAADAVRERYVALVYLLEVVLPVLAFEPDAPEAAAALLRAGDRLLGDALGEARDFRAALVERRLSAGVDYADEGAVRAALDEARAAYQQCVLRGTLAAAEPGEPAPEAVGTASRCALAVSGEPRPAALADVFRPSGLLAAECRVVVGAAPQLVAQAETLLVQRTQGRAAAAAAVSRAAPAAPPERGRLSDQVLSPSELRGWLGRVYAAEMYCHREAAHVYDAAFSPFIDAAEHVARATLDRELESRAARTRGELERRLDGLGRVLESAVRIDDALAEHGVRGVQDARTSLRNLTSGARNQRDAFERALAALDPAALRAERARRLAEIADRYAAERARLAEWKARFDVPPEPQEHPFVAGDSAAVGLEFPYDVQYPDRALRNGVIGAMNAANAHLGACRTANAGAAALVRPAPASGVCDVWPPRDRFLQWGFVRAAERATAERCSVDIAMLDAPLGLMPAPRDEAELERLAALAERTAAAAPVPDLHAALARIDALTAEFNDRLGDVERRFAAIRTKLDAGAGERLAAVAPPTGVAPSDAAAPADTAPAASLPLDADARCRKREAEERAALVSGLDINAFVRYDAEAYWNERQGKPRPDGRPGNIGDECQVLHCPAEIQTYEACVAYTHAENTRYEEQRRRAEQRENWRRNAEWLLDNPLSDARASADRFYNPQGDGWLDRTLDRAVTLSCTMYSLASIPARSVARSMLDKFTDWTALEISIAALPDPAAQSCERHIQGQASAAGQ